MAIYSGKDMPREVGRTTMDPEVKNWLKDGPVLGSHEPIHVQRAAHDRFIDTNKPPIGKVEHLGLDGPHGTIPIRCYHPSKPGIAEGAALVYLHGGGYIVGSLDQFDTAMRLFAENSGAQVYAVDYKLAPEYQFPVQIEEDEFVVRWLHEHAHERGVDPTRIALGGDSAAGTRRAWWPSSSAMRAVPSLRCRCRFIPRPRCRSTLAPVLRTVAAHMSIPPAYFSSPGVIFRKGSTTRSRTSHL